MYAKAILVALLSLSLSASAVPAKGNSSKAATASSAATCDAASAKTVTVTQTVAAASTGVLAANPGAKGTGKTGTGKTGTTGTGKTGTGAKGGNNAGTGNAAATTSSAAAAATTTSSAAAAATTTAAATTGKGGNNAASGASANAQTSLTLDPSNVFTAFASDGNANATAGQEPSITSTNNFINFCLEFPGAQKTNGQQVIEGSCNQTPMGLIAAQSKMPSSKFQFPANGGTVAANTDFTIKMAISNLETGHFTNPATTFHMAPQVVNSAGLIKGHSHVVIEQLSSLTQTTVTDPTKFAFFKGLNSVAANGVLTADVTGGLPAGFYRLASINSAANHQPALVAVAQRGALDDMVYFTVSANGAATGTGKGGNNAAAGTAATTSSGTAATTSSGTAATTSSAAAAATSKATTKTGTTGAGKGRGRVAGKNRAYIH